MTQYLTPFFSEKSNSTKGGKGCDEMFEMVLDQIVHGCLGEHLVQAGVQAYCMY